MVSFPISRYFVILYLSIFYFKSLIADPNSSFSFKNFGKNSSFESVLSLYGDAKVINGGSSLQLTAPLVSSAGRVIYRNPIKLYGGIPKKLISFSTYFSFSISDSRNGDGLAFIVFPDDYPVDFLDNNGSFGFSNGDEFKFLSVGFDVLMDDENGSHIGIDLSGFVSMKVRNLSSLNLVLKSGDRMQVWIDYEAGSKRIEVRLSKFGENWPLDPLFLREIEFSWPENEGVLVGLASSNGNSSQICNVYSWSFKTRRSPDWMHSQPLDPKVFKETDEEDAIKIHKKSDCVMRVLSALILGIGLGALGSLIGMFIWTIFGAEKCKVKPVVVDKALGNERQ